MKPSSSGGSSPSAPYRAAGSTTARSVSAHDHFRLTARDPEEGPPSLRQQNVHIFLIIYFLMIFIKNKLLLLRLSITTR